MFSNLKYNYVWEIVKCVKLLELRQLKFPQFYFFKNMFKGHNSKSNINYIHLIILHQKKFSKTKFLQESDFKLILVSLKDT